MKHVYQMKSIDEMEFWLPFFKATGQLFHSYAMVLIIPAHGAKYLISRPDSHVV